MFAVDVEKSSGRGSVAQLHFRSAMFDILRAAFDDSGINWNATVRRDLGDGVLAILPVRTPRPAVLYPLVHRLAVRLRDHNRMAGAATTMRLRMAVHMGDVVLDDRGPAGWSLELLARLLDAPALRDALVTTPPTTTVATLISSTTYDQIVRHGYPGVDPDTFRRVAVEVKETTAEAWLHLPDGVPEERETVGGQREEPRRSPQPAANHQYNAPDRGGVVYAVQGGEQHIRTEDR